MRMDGKVSAITMSIVSAMKLLAHARTTESRQVGINAQGNVLTLSEYGSARNPTGLITWTGLQTGQGYRPIQPFVCSETDLNLMKTVNCRAKWRLNVPYPVSGHAVCPIMWRARDSTHEGRELSLVSVRLLHNL
jgi:hypothetical protein